MTNRKNKLDARLGRRVRTRLTRVLVMAVAGLVMAGSLAYAAGVEPVRRRVDEFLKGTAGLFKTAESSTRDFHLSPNPSGQGVLVMPLGDRGPRPANHSTQRSGNKKEESAPSGKSKEKSEAEGRHLEKKAADSEESKTKSIDLKATSSGSDASVGSADGTEESLAQEADDSGHDDGDEGSGDPDDDRSGSNSGSDDSEDDRSGSDSGPSDSKSDNG